MGIWFALIDKIKTQISERVLEEASFCELEAIVRKDITLIGYGLKDIPKEILKKAKAETQNILYNIEEETEEYIIQYVQRIVSLLTLPSSPNKSDLSFDLYHSALVTEIKKASSNTSKPLWYSEKWDTIIIPLSEKIQLYYTPLYSSKLLVLIELLEHEVKLETRILRNSEHHVTIQDIFKPPHPEEVKPLKTLIDFFKSIYEQKRLIPKPKKSSAKKELKILDKAVLDEIMVEYRGILASGSQRALFVSKAHGELYPYSTTQKSFTEYIVKEYGLEPTSSKNAYKAKKTPPWEEVFKSKFGEK